MKKLFSIFLALLSLNFSFAFTKDDLRIFTLENGFTLYFLQDATTATVRAELNIKAGTVNQSPDNAGYFAVYAGLSGLELTPDCVKTEKTASPSQLHKILEEFASYLEEKSFTDSQIKTQMKITGEQLSSVYLERTGFINAAIDCRVFESEPWKQESGINPSVFNSKSTAQIRTVLNEIKNIYYTPDKATLYLSGNLTEGTALALTKKYFSHFKKGTSLSSAQNNYSLESNSSSERKIKKYVITDDELSSDLSQIVIQYTDLSQDETDLISQIFNQSSSQFKRLLLKQKNLAIRAADYIDASSAQQSNSSRLIIQAILEKSRVSPAVQGDLFLQMAGEKNRITSSEITSVLKSVNSNFTIVTDNSTLLMKNLAVFNQTNKESEENLFNKNERLSLLDDNTLNLKYENASPFVFLLCSTANFTKYAKEFSKGGWQRITSKNGAWYKLSRYSSVLAKKHSEVPDTSQTDLMISAQRFIEENKAQFSFFTLKNSIPVTVKHQTGAKTASIALAIEGGELLFAQDFPGLSSILINSLASKIQWQLDSLYAQGLFSSSPSVSAWTGNEYSLLTINCSAADTALCLKTASECIIFGDIAPTLADGISYDLRSQWKIKTGAPDFQLLCEAVRTIYDKPFSNLYQDARDKPVLMDFTDIAQAYPLILDSGRFSLVITGGIEKNDGLIQTLENTFGILSSIRSAGSINTKVQKLKLPAKSKKVQLRHLFFTDISADKAGPRPLVLIPTTDFSDPLLYLLEGPDISSPDCALFNALLYLTGERLEKKISAEQTVKITPPDNELPYAQITVTKIKHTNETDSLYAQTVNEITLELEELINKDTAGVKELEKEELLKELENLWVTRELEKTSSAEGTAFLIQKGAARNNACLYLDQYQAISRANAEDYYLIYKSYFSQTPSFRLYSADSKK
jgi:zinc protease